MTPADREIVELLQALRGYQQADNEGVMVLVSRQACDEAAALIERIQNAPPREPDEGMIQAGYPPNDERAQDWGVKEIWQAMFDAWQRSRGDV